MKCPKCKEGIITEVNGLYFKCSKGCLDDSTFNMIINADEIEKENSK